MLFGKKLKILKKPDKKAEQKLRDEIEEMGGLEKDDIPAMLLSAYLVISPTALAALFILLFVGWLLFGL